MHHILYIILASLLCVPALPQIAPQTLSQETAARFERVPEFKFIIRKANDLGVKVYLFGGTASAFAHYVRWDLERKANPGKYQDERFDYDFTNIYRGNQDLDIVIDGTEEQANKLKRILQENYAHFVGDRDAWEVRLLRTKIGDKLPLLDDPDFKNQSTDTNSTGMLTLNPDPNDIVFRDLLAWEDPESNFLNDVANARIRYLHSDTHEATSRFKDGKNPRILSAIRYLAKLTQYEVTGTPEDMEVIKEVIASTKYETFNDYVTKKAFEFGLKAILNSPDVEFAWDLLEKTELRKLLMSIDGNQTSVQDSTSWWLNKEPLRSFELGQGDGQTAEILFKSKDITVSHETNSFIAYDNMTRSTRGRANVFISREGVVGENAAMGKGFYTAIGLEGAKSTDLTIRFKLNPKAKEGSDFITDGEYVVVLNKNALLLIQENLDITFVGFLKLLLKGEISNRDGGLLEKFKRKFRRATVNTSEFNEARDFVKSSFFISDDFPKKYAYDNSIIHQAENLDELLDLFFARDSYYIKLITSIQAKEKDFIWKKDWVAALIEGSSAAHWKISRLILAKKGWSKHPDLIKILIEKNKADKDIVEYVLSQKEWTAHPELIEALIEKQSVDSEIVEHILSKEHWRNSPRWMVWIKTIIQRGYAKSSLRSHIFSQEWSTAHPELVLLSINFPEVAPAKNRAMFNFKDFLIKDTLAREHWSAYPHLVWRFIQIGAYDKTLIHHVFPQEHWTKHPALFLAVVEKGEVSDSTIQTYVLSKTYWSKHPVLLKYLGRDSLFHRATTFNKVSLNALRARMKEVPFNDWMAQQGLHTQLEPPLTCKSILL